MGRDFRIFLGILYGFTAPPPPHAYYSDDILFIKQFVTKSRGFQNQNMKFVRNNGIDVAKVGKA